MARRVGEVIGSVPVMVGSQVLYALTESAPPPVLRSVECDFLLEGVPARTLRVFWREFGDESPFQQIHGVTADPVKRFALVYPPDWEDRLRPLVDRTGAVVALCADVLDAGTGKLAAHRPKDIEFLVEVLGLGLMDAQEWCDRISTLERRQKEILDGIDLLAPALERVSLAEAARALRSLAREIRTEVVKAQTDDTAKDELGADRDDPTDAKGASVLSDSRGLGEGRPATTPQNREPGLIREGPVAQSGQDDDNKIREALCAGVFSYLTEAVKRAAPVVRGKATHLGKAIEDWSQHAPVPVLRSFAQSLEHAHSIAERKLVFNAIVQAASAEDTAVSAAYKAFLDAGRTTW